MAAAVDLHQARARLRQHHLGVRRAVSDLQGVQAAERVGDQLLRDRAVGEHGLLPEAYEARVVRGPAVVHPDQRCLVDAVAGDAVYDVLGAPEVLLQQHRRVLGAALPLRGHQQLEVAAHLLDRMAELHAVGPRGLHGLDDDGEGLGLREGLDLAPRLATDRAHRPKAGGLDGVLLHLLVAAVRHAVAGGVAAQAHVLGERVRHLHPGLAAAHHGRQLRNARGLAQGLGRLRDRGPLVQLYEELLREALRGLREVAPVLTHLIGPERDDREAPAIQVRRQHRARGVGVHEHDAGPDVAIRRVIIIAIRRDVALLADAHGCLVGGGARAAA
mmetsp:Transcript_49223/g.145313  ORF Transcript_49223/g.145313 Transcript_49223/m.145313 type:complete len:330 (-) Transcript_49223:26-1015(-)